MHVFVWSLEDFWLTIRVYIISSALFRSQLQPMPCVKIKRLSSIPITDVRSDKGWSLLWDPNSSARVVTEKPCCSGFSLRRELKVVEGSGPCGHHGRGAALAGSFSVLKDCGVCECPHVMLFEIAYHSTQQSALIPHSTGPADLPLARAWPIAP